jgi:hypothetical protein
MSIGGVLPQCVAGNAQGLRVIQVLLVALEPGVPLV